MSAELDWAWAAGLFEGEGSVWAKTIKTGRTYFRLSLATTDLDVLERFRDIVGEGRIYAWTRPAKAHHKQVYGWCLMGEKAIALATRNEFFSQLGQRRRARVIEILDVIRTQRPRRYRGWDQTHCIHNHEYTEANTYRTPRGHRRCVQCARDREAGRDRRSLEQRR